MRSGGDITHDDVTLRAGRLHLLSQQLETLRIDVRSDDPRTLPGDIETDLPAHPLGGAGDYRNPAFEPPAALLHVRGNGLKSACPCTILPIARGGERQGGLLLGRERHVHVWGGFVHLG